MQTPERSVAGFLAKVKSNGIAIEGKQRVGQKRTAKTKAAIETAKSRLTENRKNTTTEVTFRNAETITSRRDILQLTIERQREKGHRMKENFG